MPRRGATIDGRQGALFDAGDSQKADAGSMNFDGELRSALADAIAGSGKTRIMIAEEMEQLLGSDPEYPISRAIIDAWTAPSRTGWRFPLAYLPAFIEVTQAHWILDRLARKCGRMVVSGEHVLAAELGMIDAEEDKLKRRRRELRLQLRARK